MDFQAQTESARANINNWVDQATQGRILNLLVSGSLSESTRMVLTSAIYLKAHWMHSFSEKQTIKHPFFGLDNATFSVPMMVNTASYSYSEDALAQLVELSYVNGKWAMLCIVPQEKSSLDQIEEQLNDELFSRWRHSVRPETIHLFLPKFKMTATLNLGDILSQMGMPSAFDERADFSGIDGARDLQISKFIHKAFIDADEAGTEAAAASAAIIGLKSVLHETPPRVVKLDRPFIFIIYDKPTGAILFLGRVVNPLE